MIAKNNFRNILIVKLNRLGDIITFLPTIEALRVEYPKSQFTILTTDIGKEILEGRNLVDNIWVSRINDTKSLSGFLYWLKIIKRTSFDLAIASSDSSSFIALLFFFAGIKRRIGFTNQKLNFLFSDRITFKNDILNGELNLEVLSVLGKKKKYYKNKIEFSESDRLYVLKKLSDYKISECNGFIIVHIGANRASRRWPAERFAEIIDFIMEEYPGLRVICIGTADEKKLVNFLNMQLKNGAVINMAGQTNISQLICLINLSKLFIGHSTGPLHIAYKMGIPTISLWGAASPKLWGPMWDKEIHKIINANINCANCELPDCPNNLECMSSITVERVKKEVRIYLDKIIAW